MDIVSVRVCPKCGEDLTFGHDHGNSINDDSFLIMLYCDHCDSRWGFDVQAGYFDLIEVE